jgi:hypothetical protein
MAKEFFCFNFTQILYLAQSIQDSWRYHQSQGHPLMSSPFLLQTAMRICEQQPFVSIEGHFNKLIGT